MSHFYTLLIAITSLLFISCKKSSDNFDLLGGTGSTVDQLTIEQALPDVNSVTLEIGDSQTFSVSVVAPVPRQATYNWTLDGTSISTTSTAVVTASLSNVGSYTLTMTTNDGVDTRTRSWNVKVNGPPVITAVTTGTTKVASGSSRNISATVTDPNGDTLTYTWTINGATSSYLTGTTGTGTLTGHSTLIGSNTITLTVSDGTASTTNSWTAEVNYFPDACNTMTQGQICTYGGNPHKGNGLAHDNTTNPLRFLPLGHAQDALGNFFVADNDHYVIWYWNRTGASVSRLGSTIPANTIQVVAGTGEASTGSAGISALQSALNQPRGMWYNDVTGTLYISEYGSSRVKYINSAGTVFIGMGTTASNTDGDLAYNHQCTNPAGMYHYSGSLYIACYGSHRIKRWDLATDLAYVAAGSGTNDVAGTNVAPTAGGIGNPYAVTVDANGIYIGSWTGDRIRYVNTTGIAKTFWSGNADQVTVNAGSINTIAGDGTTVASATLANPRSIALNNPVGIVIRNSNEIYVAVQGQHSIVLFNDSGSSITIDGRTINSKQAGRINHGTGGYTGSSSSMTVARINSPYYMTLDSTSNDKLIISDYSNYRLREVDLANESIDDLAGSGRGKAGTLGLVSASTLSHYFNYPGGVVFDNTSRDLYVVDMNNYLVRRISAYGVVDAPLGRGAGDPSVDNDYATNVLFRTGYDGTNNVMTNIDFLSDGSLIQINGQNNANNIRIWNRSGSDQTYYNVYVQNDRVNTVAGNWTVAAGNGASGQQGVDTVMNFPISARAYGSSLFVVDSANHCIRELTTSGVMNDVVGLCGTSGDPVSQNLVLASARLNRPKDIAFDSLGNMIISDYSNNKLRYWNRSASPITIGSVTIPSGNLATIVCLSGGTGSNSENVSGTTAQCNTPTGLAFDSANNRICYSQRGHHNVRCMSLTTGLVNTIAGIPQASPRAGSPLDFTQEGLAATAVPLYNPTGITFDSSGDMYISDQSNHIIKKVKLSP